MDRTDEVTALRAKLKETESRNQEQAILIASLQKRVRFQEKLVGKRVAQCDFRNRLLEHPTIGAFEERGL